ncbi:unnamed protein product [Cochlearia groenlandica]
MAFERKTTIVSIALLVMIVAMTVSEVEGRINLAHFGRNLLDERRNLFDLIGAMTGKSPAPKASSSKAPTPKAAKAPKSPKSPKAAKAPKAPKSPKSPKASAPKSSKASAPKSSKTPKL